MKKVLRIFVFSYIGIYITEIIIGGFFFGGSYNVTLFLVVMAVSLLNVFLPPILSLLSLPHKGPGALFLSFLLNIVVFYMLSILLPNFYVTETVVSELIIFGFVLPSKSLTRTWSLVFSALVYVVVLHFFKWLTVSKK